MRPKCLKTLRSISNFVRGEDLELAVDRLLKQTDLKFQSLDDRFVIIYKDTKAGTRTARKLQKKIDQINKLERKNNISLQPNGASPRDQFKAISKTAVRFMKQATVSGRVVDDAGDPLIGVNVIVKGTAIGTATDLDGNYTLEVPDEASILVFFVHGSCHSGDRSW